ncbi:MAG: hypothetical protein E7643_07340 [Ruminococcaceae bacterium]|nr:hypothetical protein [Oscillospiraceae bacterium]
MISLFDQMRKTKLLKHYIVFLSAIILFHSVLYYPLYLFLDSNVLWRNSIVYLLLTEIAEPLAGYLYFWGSFAYILYVGVRFSFKSTLPFLIVYSVGTVLRYAIQNVCFIVMMGFPLWTNSLRIFDLVFSIVMDLVILGFAMLLLNLVFKSKRKSSEGEGLIDTYMPFERFFHLSNPLQKTAFLMALLPSAARLISRGYYDIRLILAGQVPTGVAEIFLMITYYITDVLTAIVGFLIIVMMLSSFRLSEVKAHMENDEK